MGRAGERKETEVLTINWKKKFEEETAKGLRSIVDDLCEQVGDDGQDIVFAWVGEHTFRLMAQAASTVLEAMAEHENYLEREGYLPGDL